MGLLNTLQVGLRKVAEVADIVSKVVLSLKLGLDLVIDLLKLTHFVFFLLHELLGFLLLIVRHRVAFSLSDWIVSSCKLLFESISLKALDGHLSPHHDELGREL